MRVRRKRAPLGRNVLVIGFALLLTIAIAVSAILTIETQLEQEALDSDRDRIAQLVVSGMAETISQQSSVLGQYALTRAPSALDTFDEIAADYRDHRTTLTGYADDPNLGPSMRRVLDTGDAWESWALLTRTSLEASPGATGDFMRGEAMKESFDRANLVLEARAEQASAASAAEVRRLSSRVVEVTLIAALLGAGGLVAVLVLLFRTTLEPIQRLADAARMLAAGEDVRLPTNEGAAEVRLLAGALETWRRASQARLALAGDTMQAGVPITLEGTLEVGAARLINLVDADLVGYTLTRPVGPAMTARYEGGELSPVTATEVPPDAPSRRVEASGKPLLTDLRDETWPEVIRAYAVERRLGPSLVLPLRSGGEALGVVVMTRAAVKPAFEPSDAEVAEVAVPLLAGAIHVAQLLEQLQTANQHKNEFLAHMSHELRTPLNSVLGFGQLLSDPTFGELNERQRRYLEHIVSSGSHLLALINDALDLSKVEAGELRLEPARVDMRDLLAESVADVRPQAVAKGVELALGPGPDLVAFADRRRVVQVVLNLLSNAIKFTPEGGRVTVTASADAGSCVVTVRDTGIGIAPADQDRIFEAFTQVRSGRTRREEGTGLGLTLSRRLAHEMGGTLTVESRPARGSSFHLRLPLAPPAGGPAAQPAARATTVASEPVPS